MKQILIIIGILSLLVLSGCTTTYYKQKTFYFNDMGNKIENHKMCEKIGREYCTPINNCNDIIIEEVICDKGECYC